MPDESLVVIENLSKSFPVGFAPAINNISLQIPKKGIVGLVGPDGAGKTTLIRLMASLLLPSSGTVSIDGHDTVTDASAISLLIGYMPQKFGLYEDLTVMQNLVLYADLQGVMGETEQPGLPNFSPSRIWSGLRIGRQKRYQGA